MIKFQNNFTTPKQSERLLELGVPADSADCGIVDDIMHGGREILQVPYSDWCRGYESISLPCWSVGRLQQIYAICFTGEPFKMWYDDNFFIPENVIGGIEEHKEELDFSKLEEDEI